MPGAHHGGVAGARAPSSDSCSTQASGARDAASVRRACSPIRATTSGTQPAVASRRATCTTSAGCQPRSHVSSSAVSRAWVAIPSRVDRGVPRRERGRQLLGQLGVGECAVPQEVGEPRVVRHVEHAAPRCRPGPAGCGRGRRPQRHLRSCLPAFRSARRGRPSGGSDRRRPGADTSSASAETSSPLSLRRCGSRVPPVPPPTGSPRPRRCSASATTPSAAGSTAAACRRTGTAAVRPSSTAPTSRASRPSSASRRSPGTTPSSARNRLTGIVTRVVRDTVMAQVEIQAGPVPAGLADVPRGGRRAGPRGRRPRRRHGEGHPGQRGRPVSARSPIRRLADPAVAAVRLRPAAAWLGLRRAADARGVAPRRRHGSRRTAS